MDYKHLKHLSEMTEKKLKKQINETQRFKESFERHTKGILEDTAAITKLQKDLVEIKEDVRAAEETLATLTKENEDKNELVKDYKNKTKEFQQKCKEGQKDVSNYKKLQAREAKCQKNLAKLHADYEDAVQEKKNLYLNYCLAMLPPEHVKDPFVAEIYRNESLEKARAKLLKSRIGSLKSETSKMEKKIKAIKKFLAKPKNEHQMKNNVEIELTDLQARIQQNLDFWGKFEGPLKDDIEKYTLERNALQVEIDEKKEAMEKIKVEKPELAEKISKIQSIKDSNITLYKQIMELRF